MRYRVVVEMHAGAKCAFGRITDGINIYLRGTVRYGQLQELFKKVRNAKDNDELMQIGWEIGWSTPIR